MVTFLLSDIFTFLLQTFWWQYFRVSGTEAMMSLHHVTHCFVGLCEGRLNAKLYLRQRKRIKLVNYWTWLQVHWLPGQTVCPNWRLLSTITWCILCCKRTGVEAVLTLCMLPVGSTKTHKTLKLYNTMNVFVKRNRHVRIRQSRDEVWLNVTANITTNSYNSILISGVPANVDQFDSLFGNSLEILPKRE